MAKKRGNRAWRQGKFVPKNRHKYGGKELPFFRSGWERSFMSICDESPSIIKWLSEEPKVPYINPNTGTRWNYHPDFVITIKDAKGQRTEMIEVKPKKQTFAPKVTKGKRKKTLINETLAWRMNIAKWKAAKAFCKQRGWTFKVMYLENNNFKEATHIRHGNLDNLLNG